MSSRDPLPAPAANDAQARGIRMAGLACAAAALILFLWPQIAGDTHVAGLPAEPLGWTALLIGWGLLIYSFARRLRGRKRRGG